jgi:peptide/nickel transport system permease protein
MTEWATEIEADGPDLDDEDLPGRKGFALRVRRKYLLRRLLFIPIGAFIVVSLAFALVNLIPGDPAVSIAGSLATPRQIAQIKRNLGLDQSLIARYWSYLDGLVHGQLGRDYYSHQPVSSEIFSHLPNTIELILPALVVAVIIGTSIGSLAAYFKDRSVGRLTSLTIGIIQSTPDFFIGLVLIYFFFYNLHYAPPPTGRLSQFDVPGRTITGFLYLDSIIEGNWGVLRDALAHSVLPVLTLGLFNSTYFARLTRQVLGRSLKSGHLEFAKACGLPRHTLFLYAIRDIRTPILTYVGTLFATLIGGAAIVETIFSWNGVGQWAVQAVLQLDLPAIQGFLLVAGLITMAVFVILDLVVGWLDPRISHDRA